MAEMYHKIQFLIQSCCIDNLNYITFIMNAIRVQNPCQKYNWKQEQIIADNTRL